MNENEERIEALRVRIHNLNIELKEKNKIIEELKKRCMRQSDEIVSLKIILSKEGYYDINRSK